MIILWYAHAMQCYCNAMLILKLRNAKPKHILKKCYHSLDKHREHDE